LGKYWLFRHREERSDVTIDKADLDSGVWIAALRSQ
jgi:hypothetical protein